MLPCDGGYCVRVFVDGADCFRRRGGEVFRSWLNSDLVDSALSWRSEEKLPLLFSRSRCSTRSRGSNSLSRASTCFSRSISREVRSLSKSRTGGRVKWGSFLRVDTSSAIITGSLSSWTCKFRKTYNIKERRKSLKTEVNLQWWR